MLFAKCFGGNAFGEGSAPSALPGIHGHRSAFKALNRAQKEAEFTVLEKESGAKVAGQGEGGMES